MSSDVPSCTALWSLVTLLARQLSASSDSGDEGANPARNDRRNNDAEAAVEVAKEAIIEQRQPQVRLSIAPDKPRNGGKRLIEINQEAWRDVPEDEKLDSYYYYQDMHPQLDQPHHHRHLASVENPNLVLE